MADKTKIDWAEASWNPVTGCLHGCEYCYARRIADRFGANLCSFSGGVWADGKLVNLKMDKIHVLEKPMTWIGKKSPYPFDFSPTFHRYRLDIPKRWQRPRNIFVCSMADLFGAWVPDEWIREVFNACREAPQHRYMFLTKAPERFRELVINGVVFPDNCLFGTSITRSEDAEGDDNKIGRLMETWFVNGVKWFVSVEPILEDLSDEAIENIAQMDWVIIGAETGTRKDKVVPEKAWIERIVSRCKQYQVPVFMKKSLREIMGNDFIREYPWEKE